MSTVVRGEQPVIRDWLAQRRALGQDTHDEVWEGVYYVAPQASVAHAMVQKQVMGVLEDYAKAVGLIGVAEFNLGEAGDFRVPDGGWLDAVPALDQVYAPTASIVLEVLSPDDKTWEKFPFYASRGVEEVLVADPQTRSVRCWERRGEQYQERAASALLGADMSDLAGEIRWP